MKELIKDLNKLRKIIELLNSDNDSEVTSAGRVSSIYTRYIGEYVIVRSRLEQISYYQEENKRLKKNLKNVSVKKMSI